MANEPSEKATESPTTVEGAAVDAGGGAVKKSKLFLIIGIVVTVLVLGGGGYFFMRARSHAAEEPAAATAETDKAKPAGKTAAGKASASQGEPVFLGLDPAFVVNFQDEEALRFLQVGIQVMSHDKVAIDAVKAAEPVVRNALVMLFSSQTYATLSTRDGKERLRTDALTEVQKIVSEQIGRPGVEAVYFTSFVMQ